MDHHDEESIKQAMRTAQLEEQNARVRTLTTSQHLDCLLRDRIVKEHFYVPLRGFLMQAQCQLVSEAQIIWLATVEL